MVVFREDEALLVWTGEDEVRLIVVNFWIRFSCTGSKSMIIEGS